jgi:hypothetical protein
MTMLSRKTLPVLAAVLAFATLAAGPGFAQAPQPSATAKPVGSVKAVNGNTITLTTDAAVEINVVIQDSTKLVKTAPGQKDLKGATAIQVQEVQVGDRVLARGALSDDGKSVLASSAIVMKKTDIADKQEHDREDWQKRGAGGLVKMIDPDTGTITISMTVAGTSKVVEVHTSKNTVMRRYSPDSVKFDDAKPGTIDQINTGDQLRARGERNPDGSVIAADEIVSGTFRNIAGTVTSIDAGKNTLSVLDLLTKKPITVQISNDSQLRKLPAFVAQRMAAGLKGDSPEVAASNAGSSALPAANGGGPRPGGGADFQQILSRLPEEKLADLQKGDAVILVTTQGSATSAPSAITLLSGVEALLTASPTAASVLSPWSLSSGGEMGAQ